MTPEGWRVARLDDVAQTFSGGTPSRQTGDYFGGPIPWVKSGEVNRRRISHTEESITQAGLDGSSARIAPKGAVLVAMYGATAGKIAQLQIQAAINQAILAVVAQKDLAASDFLLWALEGTTPELVRKVQGSGQPNLSGALLKAHEILLPPLPEQRKIAAILSSVDDAIEASQAVIDQLQVVKKAMMAELLTKGLPGRHKKFKQTEIGQVPEEWEVTPLGRLLEGIDGGWSPLCDASPAGPDDWGVLKVSAASWGDFRQDENKRLPGALAPRPGLEVKAGDLIVSRANTPELVGRSVLVRQTRPRLMLSDKLLRLRPRSQSADAAYLNLVLSTPQARAQIEDGATGTSRSMRNISQEKLRAVVVPVPPTSEQREIAMIIDVWSERILEEGNCLVGLVQLKSALMSVLLTGEVRVRVDEEAAA